MFRIFHTSNTGTVQPGRKIGIGGEGEVYEVEDRTDLVAKLYHQPLSAEKAEKLLVLSQLGTERLRSISAWPVDILLDKPEGNVVGFVMDKIDYAEELHSLHSPRSRLQKFPDASWRFLIYVAANVARAVAAVHDHGLIVGDLNPKNILVTRKSTVHLLDCDSFQVTATGKTYRCEAGFPEYTPPELQGLAFKEIDRQSAHDSFGLAVVIFQLLFLGRHPFSGRFLGEGEMLLERAISELRFAYGHDAEARQMQPPPGTLPLEAISAPMTMLFRRAFLAPSSDERPAPREWIVSLESLSQSLTRCDLHDGHQYFNEWAHCPWCEIESRTPVRLFNFPITQGGDARLQFRLDEIWEEMSKIEPPGDKWNPPVRMLKAIDASPEAAQFAGKGYRRYLYACILSTSAGVVFSFIGSPFVFLILFFLVIYLANQYAIGADFGAEKWRDFICFPSSIPKDPFVRKCNGLRREAEVVLEQIQTEWNRKADDQPFQMRLNQLQAQWKEYACLVETQKLKLQQLRDESINERLDTSPAQYQKAKIELEKDFDQRRWQMERELRDGPFQLRRIKLEIEASRRELRQVLIGAGQTLAQAEKDYEVASKRHSLGPIVSALILLLSLLMRSYG